MTQCFGCCAVYILLYSSIWFYEILIVQNVHPFIVASFNAQSVKGNDMACKRCEISTFIQDNCVDLFL